MKKYLLVFCLFSWNCVFGQDWNHWSYRFKFKIDVANTIFQFKNVEIFLNESYLSGNYKLSLDSMTQTYTLNAEYGCISCGYTNSDKPPEIYIKANFDLNQSQYPNKPESISTFIPIYFDLCKCWENVDYMIIDLGMIDVKRFMKRFDLTGKEMKTLSVIEVASKNQIKYRKRGEYIPREMNQIINVR